MWKWLVAQWSECVLPGGKDLGSNPSLVTETWLRDGHLVLSCDKLQNWTERIRSWPGWENARHEGGVKFQTAPPGISKTISSSGYGQGVKIFNIYLKFPDNTLTKHFGCDFWPLPLITDWLNTCTRPGFNPSHRNLRCCLTFSGETYHLTSTWRASPFTHAEKYRHYKLDF